LLHTFGGSEYHFTEESRELNHFLPTVVSFEPFLGLECVFVTYRHRQCLTLSQSFADGKRRQSQLFMRARVVAQGVTAAAMVGCLAWQGAQKDEKAILEAAE
jgi:hypothetical protein